MAYPSKLQIELASRVQLCRWWRFIDSPTCPTEQRLMDRIVERFNEAGGFTPEISKLLGWKK